MSLDRTPDMPPTVANFFTNGAEMLGWADILELPDLSDEETEFALGQLMDSMFRMGGKPELIETLGYVANKLGEATRISEDE